jgi:16S rRNA (adenine1518-N6/adenine1519-N6)-dimethyltransferase
MHFMLQLEVVERLTATLPATGTGVAWPSWRSSAVHAESPLFEVPSEAFEPPPKVQSAVVRLTPHRASPWPDYRRRHPGAHREAGFFAQRRKTLRNTLKPVFSDDAADRGLRT